MPETIEDELNSLMGPKIPSIIPTPVVNVLPDPKLLEDLINMGFSKEESEQALIDINNANIELAVDKVFENKNKLEDLNNNGLQAPFQNALLGSQSNTISEDVAKQEELKKLEEDKQREIEEQKRLDDIQAFKTIKESEIESIQKEIDDLNQHIDDITNTKIRGFVM